jgi:hypothetical protein
MYSNVPCVRTERMGMGRGGGAAPPPPPPLPPFPSPRLTPTALLLQHLLCRLLLTHMSSLLTSKPSHMYRAP